MGGPTFQGASSSSSSPGGQGQGRFESDQISSARGGWGPRHCPRCEIGPGGGWTARSRTSSRQLLGGSPRLSSTWWIPLRLRSKALVSFTARPGGSS
eukprot:485509-Pyramimonas_sp.AAC.1